MPESTGLGCQQPDNPVVVEGTNRIDERIDEIPIIVSPPQHNDIDDILRILILRNDLDPLGCFERRSYLLIAVAVDAHLPYDMTRLNT